MVVELDQPTSMNGCEFCQLQPNLNIFNTYIFVKLRFNLSRIPLDKFALEVSFSVTIDCQVKRLVIFRHVGRDIDDSYVCFFESIKHSCSHLTSKYVHDNKSFLVDRAFKELPLLLYVRFDYFFQTLQGFIGIRKMLWICTE